MNDTHTILIIMNRANVQYLVRDSLSTYASGGNPLAHCGGDYDSLLSNTLNHAISLCRNKENMEIICRKG